MNAFGSSYPIMTRHNVPPILSSGLLPAFTGRGFTATTDSSATLHRLAPHSRFQLIGITCTKGCEAGKPITPHIGTGQYRASPDKSACLNLKPSVITCRAIHLLGFPLFSRVTRPKGQHRFAYAMFQAPPTASFRPRRYQRRPCLEVAFPMVRRRGYLSTHRHGKHAGHTKKSCH